jgi:hypothetical protein
MKKTNKENPITFFRKANEARQKTVKSSLKKAQKGGSTYNVTNADGSPMVTPSNYTPPSVPSYPDFKKLKKTDPRNIAFRQLVTNPEEFRPKDVKKYGPKPMTKRMINKMNKQAPPPPIRVNPDGTESIMNKKGGSVRRKK